MSEMLRENRTIPVSGETQVLVAGGGIAGIAAALAAARSGAKTMLIEREYALGGMATLGLITIFLPLCDGMGHQVVYGIGEELFKLSISQGAEADYPDAWLGDGSPEQRKKQRYKVRYNATLFALLCEKLLAEAGVEILYGTLACQTVTENGRITHVIIENKSGRSCVRVKAVVDCSGDADICKYSGADTFVNPCGNGLADWYYYYSGGKVDLNMFGLADVIPDEREADEQTVKTGSIGTQRFSGVDGKELSLAVLQAHSQLMGDVLRRRERAEDFVPVSMSSVPLVRMSRRLCGNYTMESADANKHMPDSIGMTGDWTKRGPIYEIPYSSLVSDKVENLIAAGRIISVSDEVWNVTRVIPPCAVTGQAAGTAAAMFDKLPGADVARLQRALTQQNVRLHISQVI